MRFGKTHQGTYYSGWALAALSLELAADRLDGLATLCWRRCR